VKSGYTSRERSSSCMPCGMPLAVTAPSCFRAPDGGALPAVPARQASQDALVFLREWAEDRGLDIGADTNMPLWDGTRPDYDWAVAALVSEARA
jgi:hypothetical protein